MRTVALGIILTIGAQAQISVFPPAGGTSTAASTLVFNVKDYGAVGNGVTDDIAAITAAVAAAKAAGTTYTGGTVYFPAGNYAISAPITLPRTGATTAGVVQLEGSSMRGSTISGLATFTTGKSLVEWEQTSANWPAGTCTGTAEANKCGRTWNQSIKNLTLVPPAVANTGAIHYKMVQTKDTTNNVLSEWLQIDLENLQFEGSNRYNPFHVYLEGSIRFSNIRNLLGNASRSTVYPYAYNTILLQTDTCDFGSGVEGAGQDNCGLEWSQVTNIAASVMRGGYQSTFQGRLNQSSFGPAYCNGTQSTPCFSFTNSVASRVYSLGNEGFSDNPQILCSVCRNMTFEEIALSATDDAGTCGNDGASTCGYGDGIQLLSTIDSRINGVMRLHGAASFTSHSKKQLVMDASSHRNTVSRLTSTDTFANEISLSDALTNYVEGYNTAAATEAADRIGVQQIPFTQTGTGAVARTADAKLKDVVSVKDFGAVGDGTADDTAAATTAIASLSTGQTLVFPNGSYVLGSLGTVSNGITVDFGGAIVKLKTNGIFITVAEAQDHDPPPVFRGGTFKPQPSYAPTDVFKISTANDTRFERMTFSGITASHSIIWHDYGYGTTCDGCRFEDNVVPSLFYFGHNAAHTRYNMNARIFNSDLSNTTGAGVIIEGGNLNIRNTILESQSLGGVIHGGTATYLSNLTLDGVHFEANGVHNIVTSASQTSNITIQNSHFGVSPSDETLYLSGAATSLEFAGNYLSSSCIGGDATALPGNRVTKVNIGINFVETVGTGCTAGSMFKDTLTADANTLRTMFSLPVWYNGEHSLSFTLSGATSLALPASGTLMTTTTTATVLAAPYITRVCEIVIAGTGAANILQTGDDGPAAGSCYNGLGVTQTITGVYCLADTGTTTTVTPIIHGGGTILSGALTCGNNVWSSTGTLSGTPTISAVGSVDGAITNVGTAHSVHIAIKYTVPAS